MFVLQVKSFLTAAGLGALAGMALSFAMPQQMHEARSAMGKALHKMERCVSRSELGCD